MTMLRRLTLARPLASPLRATTAPRAAISPVRHASNGGGFGTSRPGRWIATTFAIGTAGLVLSYYYDSRSLAHEHVIMPVVRALTTPEEGHKLAIKVLSAPSWARPMDTSVDPIELRAEVGVLSARLTVAHGHAA